MEDILVTTKEELFEKFSQLDINFDFEKESPRINSFVPPPDSTEWKGWKFDVDSLKHTLSYAIDKLALKCQLFVISEGKLKAVFHIQPQKSNPEYTSVLKNLNPELKWPQTFHYKKQELVVDRNTYKRKDLRFMGCFVSQFEPPQKANYTFVNFIKECNEKYPLPDGVYLLSTGDALVLRNDGKEPWPSVVGDKPLMSGDYPTHIPIINNSSGINYLDIPIPNYDDWELVKDKPYESTVVDFDLEWKQKEEKVIFRGAATGCGFTPYTNTRLKAAVLGQKFPKLLDTGIVKAQKKLQGTFKEGAGYIDLYKLKIQTVNFVPFEEQSKYKYILHLDGNVAAYRLAKSMLLGSVILLQETGSRVWFQHMLIPYVHYVPVKEDLSDLISQTKWCISNDQECKRIAENSLVLGEKILRKDVMFAYFAKSLWNLRV